MSSILLVDNIDQLISTYREGLLNDIIPFWMTHSIDTEYGGYLTSLDRDGTVVDTDKSVWLQGRFVWMLSALYNTVQQRDEWLQIAKNGMDFIDTHCFDGDGNVLFSVTREGSPLQMIRNGLSEMYVVIALAEYGKAAQEPAYLERAEEMFKKTVEYMETSGTLGQLANSKTRPSKRFAQPMIFITTAQVLRNAGGDAQFYNEVIQRSIREIERDFMKPDEMAVMEYVGTNGEIIDSFEGRTLLPGHAIEGAWFILDEAMAQNNSTHITKIGADMLDWMYNRSWDGEYGGMLFSLDVAGRAMNDYSHDMKVWWPHNEAEIAAVLAYRLTGDEKFARMHQKVHDWAFDHFSDPEYGEWYSHLHRDGSLSSTLKGSPWKGGFHVPRMYWKCWQVCETIKAGRSG